MIYGHTYTNFGVEYISQLESEIATKVSENGDLRSQNRALIEENRRLSDLTRMLLSSPSFSTFLDHLSQNPAAPQGQASQPQPQPQPQQQPMTKVEPRQAESQQIPKDVNPYTAAPHTQQQTVGMVMIPEQAMDFSMLNLENESAFNYQPQVFTVVEAPEMPEIDASLLSGKVSDAVDEGLVLNREKVETPVIESPISPSIEKTPAQEASPDSPDIAVTDLDGDIYDDDIVTQIPPTEFGIRNISTTDIFGGVEPEKAFARYELVDGSEEELVANMAVGRVERLSASLEASLSRLERLTTGL